MLEITYIMDGQLKKATRDNAPGYDPEKEFSEIIKIDEITTRPVFRTEKPVYRIRISPDYMPMNPLKDCFSVNEVMIAITKKAFNYQIGNYELESLLSDYNLDSDDLRTSVIDKLLKKLRKTGYADYVSVYDHSGHSYFIGQYGDWDTATIGIIYIPNSAGFDDPEQFAHGLIKDLTSWANGDCYAGIIEKFNGSDFEEIDYSGTFYDYHELIKISEGMVNGYRDIKNALILKDYSYN